MFKFIIPSVLAALTVQASPGTDSLDSTSKARGHGRLCAELECTPEQRAEIRALRSAAREDAKDEQNALGSLRAELKAERTQDEPDAAKIAALRAEARTKKAELRAMKASAMTRVEAELTPEQLEKLRAVRAERQTHRGKAKAHRGKRKGKGHAHDLRARGHGDERPEARPKSPRKLGPRPVTGDLADPRITREPSA